MVGLVAFENLPIKVVAPQPAGIFEAIVEVILPFLLITPLIGQEVPADVTVPEIVPLALPVNCQVPVLAPAKVPL